MGEMLNVYDLLSESIRYLNCLVVFSMPLALLLSDQRKKSAREQSLSVFEEFSQYFNREEIRSNLNKFDWVPIRKQEGDHQIVEVNVIKQIKTILKENDISFIIVSGEPGCGKTKVLYEFARENKKNACFFARWLFPPIDNHRIVEEFKQLPAATQYILLDDVHFNPRQAVQFCLRLGASREKFILATRNKQELIRIFKEFRIEQWESIDLKTMENIGELLDYDSERWLTLDVKMKLLSISEKNPEVLVTAHEFVEQKIETDNKLDVLSLLTEVENKEQLFKLIMDDIQRQLGEQALELIARSVILQGLDKSHPFCKITFRSYIKLRSMNYFYVQNDKIFFKPSQLGEYIARHYYFPEGEIKKSFNDLVEDATPADLEKIIISLLLLNKTYSSPVFKDAAGLVIASIKNKEVDDTTIARLCITFNDYFKDPKVILDSVDRIFELDNLSPDPELINQLAIFYAENQAYENAATSWERLLEIAREKHLDHWIHVAYNNLGLVYQNLKDWENAIECYQLAYNRFEAAGVTQGMVQSLINLAQIYQKKGDWEQSIQFFKKAIEGYDKIGDPDKAGRLHITIAQIYKKNQDLENAILHYQSARTYFKKTENIKGLIQVYGNLGIIYKRKNDPEATVEYFSKTLENAKKTNDLKTIAHTYNNLALAVQEQGKIKEAVEYYQQSIEKLYHLKDIKGLSLALNNLALIYQSQNEWDQAFQFHQRALAVRERLADRTEIAETLSNLGIVAQEKEDWQRAESFYQQAIQVLKEINGEVNARIYGNLGIVYQKQHKYDEAIEAFQQACVLMNKSDRLDEMAKTYAHIGLTYFRKGEYEQAIAILTQVLFFFLNQKMPDDVKEVTQVLKQIQNAMDDNKFNEVADQVMKKIETEGVHWLERIVMSGKDAKKLIERLKQRKVKRVKKKKGENQNVL